MKKSLLVLSLMFSVAQAIAQSEETVNETLKITTGGTFSKPKILRELEKIAVTQATVYFKTATTREVLENDLRIEPDEVQRFFSLIELLHVVHVPGLETGFRVVVLRSITEFQVVKHLVVLTRHVM